MDLLVYLDYPSQKDLKKNNLKSLSDSKKVFIFVLTLGRVYLFWTLKFKRTPLPAIRQHHLGRAEKKKQSPYVLHNASGSA